MEILEMNSFLKKDLTKKIFPQEIITYPIFLNETWFSDRLAWLLNPKENHRLGVNFGKALLKKIAELRSNKNLNYENGKSFLSKQLVRKISLRNSTSIRELYSIDIKKYNNKISKFNDIVFLDLDVNDNFIVVIENKLFNKNTKGQLLAYFEIIDEKYKNIIQTREYVYLTLNGNKPHIYEDSSIAKKWIQLSWLNDILEILNELSKKNNVHPQVIELISLLQWLKNFYNNLINYNDNDLINKIHNLILKTNVIYICSELNRLTREKTKKWYIDKETKNSIIIKHKRTPKRELRLKINNNNLSLIIESFNNKNQLIFKKIFPFGVQAEQALNFIDIEILDIYDKFFDNKNKYKNKKQRKKEHEDNVIKKNFVFFHKYKLPLQTLVAINKIIEPEKQTP